MDTHAVVFSPDSKTLANGGAELGGYNAINTWDTATGTHKNTFALLTVGSSVLYTPDGKSIVAAAKDDTVHLYDARTGKSIRTFHGPGGHIISLALSSDGRRVAIGTIVPTCSLQVRDLRSGHVLWTLPVPRPEAEVPPLRLFSRRQNAGAWGSVQHNLSARCPHRQTARHALRPNPRELKKRGWQ